MADMLSQDEINALLGGGDSDVDTSVDVSLLTDNEKDILGEVGNISMGTAATTLFTLLNQKVTITTPRVSEVTFASLIGGFDNPCVVITVDYIVGTKGSNILVMNDNDVKIITDLMMGGDGTNVPDELGELQLSAISEAMNQMIGSASTSLSEMVGKKIDISPPQAIYDEIENIDEERLGLNPHEKIVMIAFEMKIGDLVDSEIFQLMPADTAKQLISSMTQDEEVAAEPAPQPDMLAPETQAETPMASQAPAPIAQTAPQAPAAQTAPQASAPQPQRSSVNAQNVQFQNFGEPMTTDGVHGDISLIQEVPLEISVELGRTTKKISDILDFSTGSVIELDCVVGESLNILANGRTIAKGEVVVVDENYGVRITEIVVPQNRWAAN